MRFTQVTHEEFSDFVELHRHCHTQLPEYARARAAAGGEVEILGAYKDSGGKEALVAAAVVVYQPWARFFKKAVIAFGPLVDFSDLGAVSYFLTGLRTYLKRKKNVIVAEMNPLLPVRFYDDIQPIGTNAEAAPVIDVFTRHGMRRIDAEFYERPGLQARYIYTKDVAGKTFEEATATLAKGLRRRFHNEGRYGVEVRCLPPEQFHVFEGLHESTAERTTAGDLSRSSATMLTNLMKELGPERSVLAVAFLRPQVYIDQIDAEVAELTERIAVLEARPQTANRDRELEQVKERIAGHAERRGPVVEILEEFGEEIPFNGALAFQCGRELLALAGGMDKRFFEYARDYPVERELFKWTCDHGLDTYNTFGISGIFDETAPDKAVLAFKRLLRGKVEEFTGTWVMPIRPTLMKATKYPD